MIYVIFLTFTVNFLVEVKTTSDFPDDFIFGVATASYQIEGAWNACGKGENIWDHLVHTHPEKIVDNSTGDVACDSYHLYQQDISYLGYMGVNFYRFSISWSRLLPTGFRNVINPDGVRYYQEILENLKRSKVQAMVTLYHWDLPQPLQDLGGWANPVMATYFAEYADVVFSLFSPYVNFWITFNEPGEICESGYGIGVKAPIIQSSGIGDYLCGKTLLLAHARAYHIYNTKYRSKYKALIGITISSPWYEPKYVNETETSDRTLRMERESATAGQYYADVLTHFDVELKKKFVLQFGWWANPIFSKKGDYPQIMKDRIGNFSHAENFTACRLPPFTKSEVKFIRGTADFLGLNHYTSYLVSTSEQPLNATPSHAKDLGVLKEQDAKWEPSSVSWLKVVPWGFRKLLKWIKKEYDNPLIYITENGYADYGEISDKKRIMYHTTYMRSMLDAITKDNVNVKGYAIWSLMDNMEWNDGYTAKFGLYYVYFNETARNRRPKSSVEFYKTLIVNRQIPAVCFDENSDGEKCVTTSTKASK